MAVSREEQIEAQLKRNRNRVGVAAPTQVFNDAQTSYYKEGNLESPTTRLQDNPNFIFPGPTTRAMGVQPYKPVRGYIRRLNEFYSRMGEGASDIQGRRCNFQFQPETIVRSVSSNSYDTQYFFNQQASQLTVPIPGQSTYGLKLLFNREAEVASGYYMSRGQKVKGKSFSSIYDPLLETSEDIADLIEGDFDQSWVTKIGVLADIMVLDGVIGQGISKETLTTIKKIAESNAQNPTEPVEGEENNADEQDKDATLAAEAASYWLDDTRNNANLGNQAFLVPTPVRIVLSNLMIIEGFVLSSSVNFHKFSKKFVPTQATVELSVQALYIGFAKKTTILTQDPSLTESGSAPDEKTKTEADIAVEKATLDGVKSFYKSVSHHKGGKDLLNYILKTDPQQSFNFTLRLSEAGFNYRINTLSKAGGGEPSFHWTGTISMYWDSYVSGASNSRQPTRTSATGGTLTKGYPAGFEQWGTISNPLVIATGAGQIYEDLPNAVSLLDDDIDHIIGDNDSDAFGLSAQEEAKWDMNLPAAINPRPFEQDKFRVQLEIKITLQRFGVSYPVGQRIVYNEVSACGDDVLFKKLSFAATSQT